MTASRSPPRPISRLLTKKNANLIAMWVRLKELSMLVKKPGKAFYHGRNLETTGFLMPIHLRKIDAQGRITLPSEWRKKISTDEILIFWDETILILKPKLDPDLTKDFDSVAVEIDPEDFDFEDYHRVKRLLLSGD